METPNTKDLLIGYFGASTGTAAIVAATNQKYSNSKKIYAVVSRSGRPDLAGLDSLSKIKSPTLLRRKLVVPSFLKMNLSPQLHFSGLTLFFFFLVY
jgi:hypothetical protein